MNFQPIAVIAVAMVSTGVLVGNLVAGPGPGAVPTAPVRIVASADEPNPQPSSPTTSSASAQPEPVVRSIPVSASSSTPIAGAPAASPDSSEAFAEGSQDLPASKVEAARSSLTPQALAAQAAYSSTADSPEWKAADPQTKSTFTETLVNLANGTVQTVRSQIDRLLEWLLAIIDGPAAPRWSTQHHDRD